MDGSEPSDAAVRVAAALAAAGRLVPSAISINRLTPLAIGAPMPSTAAVVGALLGEEGEGEGEGEWIRSVRNHAFDVALAAAEWPIRFEIGEPARVIDDTAVATGAALVIMGLHHHGLLARVARDETTLNVIRRGHVPVFGVAPRLRHIPRRIVVGMDFSGASQRAAALAAQLLAEGGELTLAYAEGAFDYSTEANEGLGLIHREGIKAAFAHVLGKLSLPAGATVGTVNVDSVPSAGLLELADRLSADLIAVGRQRHDPVERVLFGSVASDLVRDGRCSVLVTPPIPKRHIRKSPATRIIL